MYKSLFNERSGTLLKNELRRMHLLRIFEI